MAVQFCFNDVWSGDKAKYFFLFFFFKRNQILDGQQDLKKDLNRLTKIVLEFSCIQ